MNSKLYRLINQSEEKTHIHITEAIKHLNARVFVKVRIADIFKVNSMSLSADLFNFSLKAHFDFTITDGDFAPLFSVEFDGPYHKNYEQKERDRKKDLLCEMFDLPILRINSNYLIKKYRNLDILTYLIECWFCAEAFRSAQAEGIIPEDEPFDQNFIINIPEHNNKFPLQLSYDIIVSFRKNYEMGHIIDPGPSYFVGYTKEENMYCIAFIKVNEKNAILVQTGMKKQNFPFASSDLISDIAIYDLYEKYKVYKGGNIGVLITIEELSDKIQRFRMDYRHGQSAIWGNHS